MSESVRQWVSGSASCALLALTLLSGCTTRQAVVTSSQMQGVAVAREWTREELYLGLNKPDGSQVSNEEFDTFIKREVAPRICCFTILNGTGYYTPNSATPPTQEPTRVLVVLYSDAEIDVAAKLSAIALSYVRAFAQESVLRVAARVRANFVK